MTDTSILATAGGFVVGVLLGSGIVAAINLSIISHHSRRECRNCLRKRVEYGFHIDGKEYKCVEKNNDKRPCDTT